MTGTRVTLTTAGIVAGVLLIQGLIVGVWNIAFGYFAFGGSVGELVGPNLFWSLFWSLLHYAAFGFGVFVSIRYIAPVTGACAWRHAVIRGVIATICGAVFAVVYGVVASGIAAITVGAYPFGYSLDAAVDPIRIQFGIQNVVAGSLTPLVEWLPLTVLACVLLKLWRAGHPESTPAIERVSVAGKP
jgi:hypothetical protein